MARRTRSATSGCAADGAGEAVGRADEARQREVELLPDHRQRRAQAAGGEEAGAAHRLPGDGDGGLVGDGGEVGAQLAQPAIGARRDELPEVLPQPGDGRVAAGEVRDRPEGRVERVDQRAQPLLAERVDERVLGHRAGERGAEEVAQLRRLVLDLARQDDGGRREERDLERGGGLARSGRALEEERGARLAEVAGDHAVDLAERRSRRWAARGPRR